MQLNTINLQEVVYRFRREEEGEAKICRLTC